MAGTPGDLMIESLPFAAALHGRELLHAGGVVVGDEAVAILGPSGRGKSTLVGALVQAGRRSWPMT